jgi:histidine ammonia-lyase
LLSNVECVLAIELLSACQGLSLLNQQGLRTTAPLEAVYAVVRETIPFYDKDRYMKPDIDSALSILQRGLVWDTVKPFLHALNVDVEDY